MRQWADQDRIVELGVGTPLGKYKVVRLIGAGAMGSVYEAEHTETSNRVAIKVLDPQLAAATGASARFRLEGSLTNRVRHPHVVDVIEVGDDAGRGYLVMELLTGEDLGRRLERSGPIPAAETADILIPVCDAIGAAHRLGITHRDLKPHNIFLAEGYGGGVHPKVLDFGIAISEGAALAVRDVRGSIKGVAPLVGSPCYLAPEQVVSSRSAGPATDQYALGVIAYECLTGRRPFDGDNLNAVLLAIARGAPARPSEVRPEVPAGLEEIVLRAMSRTPSDRFASVAELGRALLPFASPRVRLAWGAPLAGRSGEAKSPAATDAPTPEPEPSAAGATRRTLIGAPRHRSPSSPAIQAEAATPSPFVRTLPPEVPELSEVSEPSLIPAVALDPPPDSGDPGAGDDGRERVTGFARIAPLLANKWARSAGIAIALGTVALLVARGRSSEPNPAALIPAAGAPAPAQRAAELPVPAPAPPPLAPPVEAEPVKPEAVAAPVLPEETVPRTEVAPTDETVGRAPAAEVARADGGRPARREKPKASRDAGTRRKRRVPLLD